jgi:hypothetical protein
MCLKNLKIYGWLKAVAVCASEVPLWAVGGGGVRRCIFIVGLNSLTGAALLLRLLIS